MSFNLKNTFSEALVNTDDDVRYVSSNSLTKANNVDILLTGSSKVVSSILGNVLKGGRLNDGDIYIGNAVWGGDIYLFFSTATDNYIQKYSSLSETFTLVARNDLSLPLTGDADYDKFVMSADVIQGVFLFWTGGIRQSNGDLDGYKEPKRLHIEDASANPTTYDNFSANLDRPSKLSLSTGYNDEIINNLLKYNSYVFYKILTNKYNERTVLSYPSENIDVSYSDTANITFNYIDIVGFTVSDDIYSVDILMENDSSNTFSIIKTVDTTVNKDVSGFTFINKNEYPVLDASSSDIINYQFPLKATEQEVVDNRVVFADVDMDLEFEDENGDDIDKSIPFNFTATGLSTGNDSLFYTETVPPASGPIPVTFAFTDGMTYSLITTYTHLAGFWSSFVKTVVTYKYETGNDWVADLNALFNAKHSYLTVVAHASPVATNFNMVYAFPDVQYATTPITFQIVESEEIKGLNNDFTYKGGIVFLDDKGRNYGVSNTTSIFYQGEEWVFGTTTNLGGTAGLKAPSWATKYMIVRDKVNTRLNYSVIINIDDTTSPNYVWLTLGSYSYNRYLNELSGSNTEEGYFESRRSSKVIVYHKNTQSEINGSVPSINTITDRSNDLSEGIQYLDVANNSSTPTLAEGDIILYTPNKEVEHVSEVFYETSDVFDIERNPDGSVLNYKGDFKELQWYDTKIGQFKDFNFNLTPNVDDYYSYPIMITDTESTRDINHLGRGAYSVISDVNMNSNATLVHSQQYSPSTNYNGLGVFSSVLKNFMDLENKYGAVEKLYYDDTNLIIGQKKKWSKVLINKSLLTSAGGDGTLTESKEFLNTVIPYAGDWGITDKQSFAVFGFRKYFVDENSKIMGRLSVDGVTVINALRDFEISEIIDSQDNEDRIIGGYDVNKQEYVVCFESTGRIMRFSEYNKNQVGEYVSAVLPKDFILTNKHMFTIGDGDNKLYEEGVGDVNNLYGNTVTNEIQISVNQEADTIKDYISISQHIDSVWALDTKIETLKNTTNIPSNSQGTAEWTLREDIQYADIRKDELSSGQAVFGVGTVALVNSNVITFVSAPNNMLVGGTLYVSPVFPDDGILGIIESISDNTITLVAMLQTPDPADFVFTKRDSIVEGESIKGSYALITLTNNTTTPFELYSVTTGVNISSHNDLQ